MEGKHTYSRLYGPWAPSFLAQSRTSIATSPAALAHGGAQSSGARNRLLKLLT